MKLDEQSSYSGPRSIAWGALFSAALTLMALGVPILYLVGLAFDQGYQSVFRVPEVGRSGGFHEILMLGFLAVHYALRFLVDWMPMNWGVMAIYGLAAGVVAAIGVWCRPEWLHSPRRQIRTWLCAHKNFANGVATFAVSSFVFGLPYIMVALAYLVLSIPLLSFQVGRQVATRNLERQAATCEMAAAYSKRFNQCVIARRDDEIVRGYIVATTADYFVLALNGQTRAIPIEGWEFEANYTPFNAAPPTSK